MTYENVLVVHIVGALATAGAGAYALVSLWNYWSGSYRKSALVLGALATFEIVTGTLLAVFSLRISAASVCERLVLYLALVAIIELLLFRRMSKFSIGFPAAKVIAPIAGSLGLLFTALVAGF